MAARYEPSVETKPAPGGRKTSVTFQPKVSVYSTASGIVQPEYWYFPRDPTIGKQSSICMRALFIMCIKMCLISPDEGDEGAKTETSNWWLWMMKNNKARQSFRILSFTNLIVLLLSLPFFEDSDKLQIQYSIITALDAILAVLFTFQLALRTCYLVSQPVRTIYTTVHLCPVLKLLITLVHSAQCIIYSLSYMLISLFLFVLHEPIFDVACSLYCVLVTNQELMVH